MKTHDFARQLSILAKILKNGPNIELSEMDFTENHMLKKNKENINEKDIPKALSLLVGLNEVSKERWLALINEYDFKVPVRPRDANRDVIGKLLKYLSNNPQEREKLTGKQASKKIGSSNELANALSILLD